MTGLGSDEDDDRVAGTSADIEVVTAPDTECMDT